MKTTSLELSKRIAKLEGGKRISVYQWYNQFYGKEEVWKVGKCRYINEGKFKAIPAYTTDELSDLLPYMIEKKSDYDDKIEKWFLSIAKTELNWLTRYTWYYYEPMDDITQQAETMVESMGLMYEHLLKEGIIKSN